MIITAKLNLLPAILVASIQFGFAQPVNGDSITFYPRWEKGEVFHYDVSRKRTRTYENTLQQNDTFYYRLSFGILDKTTDGYLIKWQITNSHYGQQFEPEENLLALAAKISAVSYYTNEKGIFSGLQNGNEIRNKLDKLLEENLERKRMNAEELAAATAETAQLKKMYANDAALVNYFFREIFDFHSPFGGTFPTSNKLVYQNVQPNFVAGGTMPSVSTFAITHIDTSNAYCEFEFSNAIEEHEMKKFLDQVNATAGTKSIDPSLITTSTGEICDSIHGAYNYTKCIPQKVQSNRVYRITLDGMNFAIENQLSIKIYNYK